MRYEIGAIFQYQNYGLSFPVEIIRRHPQPNCWYVRPLDGYEERLKHNGSFPGWYNETRHEFPVHREYLLYPPEVDSRIQMEFQVGDIVWFNKNEICWKGLPPLRVELLQSLYDGDVFRCKVLDNYMPIWSSSRWCDRGSRRKGYLDVHISYLTHDRSYSRLADVDIDVSEFL